MSAERFMVAREEWPAGPWDGEADREEFRAAGLPCLLNRGFTGAWCGYVAVPPGHPLHGMALERLEWLGEGPMAGWGLSYADACGGQVCHEPRPGEPADVWWIGFDFAHTTVHVIPCFEALGAAGGTSEQRGVRELFQLTDMLGMMAEGKPSEQRRSYVTQAQAAERTRALAQHLAALR